MDKVARLASKHWIVALVLFSIYGIQVCPFLEAQTPLQLLLPIVLGFTFTLLLRRIFCLRIERKAKELQVAAQFKLDLVLFMFISVIVVTYNSVMFEPPWESNLKVILGLSALGFYIAADLALLKEWQIALELEKTQQHLAIQTQGFAVGKKFSAFAISSAFVLAGIIFLVINKDLEWLVMVGSERYPLPLAQRYIVTELAFVLVVVMAYVIRVIFSYSRNLQRLLHNQNNSLAMVQNGQLDTQVTVSSNDEFGIIAQRTNTMISSLQRSTHSLHQTRDIAIHSLASLAETRDNETGAHILRTQYYVKALAEELKHQPGFVELLTEQNIELIYKSAPLHDIGKVGIPDAILLKPGKLDDEQWLVMRQHPQIGANALAEAERHFGSEDAAFLQFAKEIALSHHEKWDGSGYPHGSVGSDIPLSARLMALADVYDALISKRVYKPAFSHDKAKQIILEGKGKHFDPAVVEAFCRCEQQFVEIAAQYQDKPGQAA
ncbi:MULTISPECIES: HD-GYP domain-containing protein [unclassified Agarivorans]|uniref:HD-GYP domain-containing protein n=1 Tax=unclassified Agarivorans TaxID=2636026 RepID=UPI0026E3D845|nr:MULTISPECIES: HD domain-containing phosphohydrolase [unclassified Agarivorans]MDO6687989.1 HD domain-containing protein [Agarivorans sp. 3_MG-2023]MDO6717594.1 HD domain-containing protein [Agarivorans sp. 2_MG-2023]